MSALRRPEPETSFGFKIFSAANGNWIVEGPRCGGVFVDETAALRFVHDEERVAAVELRRSPSACVRPSRPDARLAPRASGRSGAAACF